MIKNADFSAVMDALWATNGRPNKMAVATSGGADSLCLALLANKWAQEHRVKLYGLTVDHGLRKESAQEACFVHDVLSAHEIEHTTLVWEGKKPKTRVEEKAREERYRLLLSWCKAHHVPVLLIAHHQDDQAETFFLRLIRSSGVDGLSGMQPQILRDGIQIWRPFLAFSRKQIQDTMKNVFHQVWVEDPSNQSQEYERVRLRQFQENFDALGLTTAAVALSAKRLLRARMALEQVAQDFWTERVLRHEGGFIFIDRRDFASLSEEIALRILAKAFMYVAENQARMSQLETLYPTLQRTVRTTLCDCVVISNKKGIYICAELAKMENPLFVAKNTKVIWNGFEVCCNQDITIGPMGVSLKEITLPAMVQKVIPAFFDKKGLAFVPALDYKRKKTDNINGSIQKKE